MKVVQVPNTDYYLQKGMTKLGSAFYFPVRACGNTKGTKVGYLCLGKTYVSVPKEFVGKKLMFKVEIYENKKSL